MTKFVLTILLMIFVCGCSPYYFSDEHKVWMGRYNYYFAKVRPEWSEDVKSLILEGNFRVGMTLEQVALATRSGYGGVRENLWSFDNGNFYHWAGGMRWEHADSYGNVVYSFADRELEYRLYFSDDVLKSWSKSPHIIVPSYVAPMGYYDSDGNWYAY